MLPQINPMMLGGALTVDQVFKNQNLSTPATFTLPFAPSLIIDKSISYSDSARWRTSESLNFLTSSATTGASAAYAGNTVNGSNRTFDTYTAGTQGTTSVWSFAKAGNFYDSFTYIGDGSTIKTLSHNLRGYPGLIIVKRLDSTSNWTVWQQSFSTNSYLSLNTTDIISTNASNAINSVTNTQFTIGSLFNISGASYIVMLFGHQTSSGGFIRTGTYVGTGTSGNMVELGWEPQWIVIKSLSNTGLNWTVFDNLRVGNSTLPSRNSAITLNTAGAQATNIGTIAFTSTGFSPQSGSINLTNGTYIYLVIRKGLS